MICVYTEKILFSAADALKDNPVGNTTCTECKTLSRLIKLPENLQPNFSYICATLLIATILYYKCFKDIFQSFFPETRIYSDVVT